MDPAEYVLCNWKGQLWPAKVLSQSGTSTTTKGRHPSCLEVEILPVGEKIQVKSTEVRALTRSEIETIASLARMESDIAVPPSQGRAYRRALKVALDVLNEGTSLIQGRLTDGQESTMSSPESQQQLTISSPCQNKRDEKHQGHFQVSVEKRRQPRPLLVRPETGGALPSDKSPVNTTVAPLPPEVQATSSQSTSVCPGDLTCSLAAVVKQEKGQERFTRFETMSAPTCIQRTPSRQRSLTLPKVLNKEAQYPSVGMWAMGTHGSSTIPRTMKDSGPDAQKADWEGTMPSIFSPQHSLHSENRNGKLHELSEKVKLPALESQVSSKEISTMDPKWRVSCQQDPLMESCNIERGMLVWFKFQYHPYWPAVVKSVSKTHKSARVLMIEDNLHGDLRGISIPLHKLKPLDCQEKETFLRRARKVHKQGVNWCFSLISNYRKSITEGSFEGSFLDYYTTQASYPIRKTIQEGSLHIDFPKICYTDPEDWEEDTTQGRKWSCKKPDHMKASCDQANQKLVDFIVKRKGADKHLLDIMKCRKPSKWLASHLNAKGQPLTIQTYLEDEEQLYAVAKHLHEIYKQSPETLLTLTGGDKVNFTIQVLLPEAIICAIAALDGLDYEAAEKKYLCSSPLHRCEKDRVDKNASKAQRKSSAARSQSARAPPSPTP